MLTVIGEGSSDHVARLNRLVSSLKMTDCVRFLGRVSASRKHQEMADAHMILLASVREGWGLVVTEANAYSTPAVAYDVPGLRDSVVHEETGLLVSRSPRALADGMSRLWSDRELYRRLSAAARIWSETFSFDDMADVFRAALQAAQSRSKEDLAVRPNH